MEDTVEYHVSKLSQTTIAYNDSSMIYLDPPYTNEELQNSISSFLNIVQHLMHNYVSKFSVYLIILLFDFCYIWEQDNFQLKIWDKGILSSASLTFLLLFLLPLLIHISYLLFRFHSTFHLSC